MKNKGTRMSETKTTDVEFCDYAGMPKSILLTKWGLKALNQGISLMDAQKTMARMRRKSSP